MSISIKAGPRLFEIGSSQLLHAFFSTVSFHLEPRGWGTRYPDLLVELYQGHLASKKIPKALVELNEIKSALSRFKPNQIVWDIENLKVRPPWGDNIAPSIQSLADYFATSDGHDLIDVLNHAMKFALEKGFDLAVVTI